MSPVSRQGKPILVTGAGGFIGGHLTASLLEAGETVRAVDCKPLERWFQLHEGAENRVLDLSLREAAEDACEGCGEVYNLAADMGGMGFIEGNKAQCMLSVLINTHLLSAARDAGVERFFYSSSACVYAAGHQSSPDVTALREEDAYPAQPEDGYGWEKLFSERMCRHFTDDFGLETRVARYHNVYGRSAPGPGGVRRRRRRSAARSPRPPSPADGRSRSGVTASRPAASCTSTTACAGRGRYSRARGSIRSTSAAPSW